MSEIDNDIRAKYDLRTSEGRRLANEEQVRKYTSSKKSILVAFLFWWFLLHYFYVGRFGRGLIYFLTVGGFGFWALYDLFVILFGNLKDSEGRYVKY